MLFYSKIKGNFLIFFYKAVFAVGNNMKKIFLAISFVLAVQSAFCRMSCEGMVYLKLPDGWATAYAVTSYSETPFVKSKKFPGWFEVSTDDIGKASGVYSEFFIKESAQSNCETGHCISRKSMNVCDSSMTQGTGFQCSDFGEYNNELWIQENPDSTKADIPYFSTYAADVKYFRIFLPNNVAWKTAIPMIQEDGKPGVALDVDSERCGWYFRRYIGETPASAIVYRDDDEQMMDAIGVNGDWEDSSAAHPIPLSSYFEIFQSNELFFVAASEFADPTSETMGWTSTDPGTVGDCEFNLAAVIYDTDASLHGAFTCAPSWNGLVNGTDVLRYNACYYATAKYPVTSNGESVVPCLGVTPGMVSDTLIPDSNGNKKPTLTENGRKCFGEKADEAFAAMFNPTPGVNETYCYDLPFSRASDGMWEFNSDNFQSPSAPVPGGFYPAEKTPNGFHMMSERLPAAESKRRAEGPSFFCADYSNNSKTPKGLRTIDSSEGVPVSELICNGPGWDGGIDCKGLFVTGDEFSEDGVLTTAGLEIQKAFDVSWAGDGWGWSCDYMAVPVGWRYYEDGTEYPAIRGSHQWVSGNSDSEILTEGGRNQHFCLETHAMFRYKKGLHFSFSGDDDIWVYLDNKLAVDLGGAHLAAPGYVDVGKVLGAKAEIGHAYDIDIYYCDRRTKMNNLRIKTNMAIEQVRNFYYEILKKSGGIEEYELIFSISDVLGTCVAGNYRSFKDEELERYLVNQGKMINYFIVNEKNDTLMAPNEMRDSKTYLNDGINIVNRTKPKIDKNKVKGLPSGSYTLVAEVDGYTVGFNFKILDDSGDAIVARNIASSGFRIERSSPLAFSILLDKSASKALKSYAVFDMLGKEVKHGEVNSSVTQVQLSHVGSYIVKVGKNYQRIEIK